MSSETTATTLTEMIRREAYAESQLFFAANQGVSQLVTKKDLSGQATLTARFPLYNAVTALAIGEASDFTTNSALDTTNSVDVAVSEHAIKFTLTDLMLGATVEEILSNRVASDTAVRVSAEAGVAGRAAAVALQALQDQDICALFSAFNSSTGDADGAITTTLLTDAIAQLNIDNIPRDRRSIVLHPFQWKTLMPSYDDASVFGVKGAEIIGSGVVGSIYGCLVFETSNIATATIGSSTCWPAAVMHATAIALATKGSMPMFETERDASLRAVELVGTGVWGQGEYRGGATTSGIGGAGVLLYSNSTI
jgi:hypothetical protein